jgi:hypothetical protein
MRPGEIVEEAARVAAADDAVQAGGVQPGAQRVGAVLGPMCPPLGSLGPGMLAAAIGICGVVPALGGPPVSISRLSTGFCAVRAITLQIRPLVRLIRPNPLKIGDFLSPVGPLALTLPGRVHGVMTGRLSGNATAN